MGKGCGMLMLDAHSQREAERKRKATTMIRALPFPALSQTVPCNKEAKDVFLDLGRVSQWEDGTRSAQSSCYFIGQQRANARFMEGRAASPRAGRAHERAITGSVCNLCRNGTPLSSSGKRVHLPELIKYLTVCHGGIRFVRSEKSSMFPGNYIFRKRTKDLAPELTILSSFKTVSEKKRTLKTARSDMKDMRLEAEAVVNDVLFAVNTMFVSKTLCCADDVAYINVETRERNRYCLELTEAGLGVVGCAFDQVDDGLQTPCHETVYSLLDALSPAYREAFGNALLQRIETEKGWAVMTKFFPVRGAVAGDQQKTDEEKHQTRCQSPYQAKITCKSLSKKLKYMNQRALSYQENKNSENHIFNEIVFNWLKQQTPNTGKLGPNGEETQSQCIQFQVLATIWRWQTGPRKSQEHPCGGRGGKVPEGREAEGAILKKEEEKAYLPNFLQTSILITSNVKGFGAKLEQFLDESWVLDSSVAESLFHQSI
eukprot:bmy_18228T0